MSRFRFPKLWNFIALSLLNIELNKNLLSNKGYGELKEEEKKRFQHHVLCMLGSNISFDSLRILSSLDIDNLLAIPFLYCSKSETLTAQ